MSEPRQIAPNVRLEQDFAEGLQLRIDGQLYAIDHDCDKLAVKQWCYNSWDGECYQLLDPDYRSVFQRDPLLHDAPKKVEAITDDGERVIRPASFFAVDNERIHPLTPVTGGDA